MFELHDFCEAKITVQNRTEKHGDEDVPAVIGGRSATAVRAPVEFVVRPHMEKQAWTKTK